MLKLVFALACAFMVVSGALAQKKGEEVAILETNLGKIVIKFFPDKAPNHVKNFKNLAKSGFYNGTKFHRVLPGFMIQGGDPLSKDSDRSNDGTGGNGKPLKLEPSDIKHKRGILSMARTSDPNSATCQFFIMVGDAPHLDGQYSAFGQVVSGMDVVDKIVKLPRDPRDNPEAGNPAIVKKVTIAKWPVK
ncbi:MAG TPA: peptidylprolyl isomerase [Fimbriimonadaceae bacterium]|nr:peptidylprolyl isomerase [Fimbriimonadaceae bacterium]